MKTFLLSIGFLLILFGTFAQHNGDLSFVNVPPSPTSSKFKIYTDNQPDISSGAVNVPIDLFNLPIYGYNFQLQLIYNSSGINIMDSPVPYGYGWKLNLNPRVTRQLLGRADETYPFKNTYNPADSDWGYRYPGISTGHYGDYYEPLKGIVSWQHAVTYQLTDQDLYDPQKDIFTIQLPNKTVRFILDWANGVPEAKTYGNSLQIVPLVTHKKMVGIKVTDEDGTVYRFGNLNGESGFTYLEYYDGVNVSWLLREIELTNGQKIAVDWVEKNVSNTKPSVSYSVTVDDWKLTSNWGDASVIVDDLGGIINIAEYSSTTAKMLSKITTSVGTINFVYTTANEPLVTEINLKNLNGNILHKATLAYGPRNTPQDHLLLQTLKVDNQLHGFFYNNSRFSKGTTSLDYWGFFNGKSQNTHVPRVNLKIFSSVYLGHAPPDQSEGLIVGLADKSVDTAKMKAMMLEKIVYPTGGYTRYEYEPHQFNYHETYPGFFISPTTPTVGGGLRVKKISFYDSDNSLKLAKTYKYGRNENGIANIKLIPTLNTFIDERFQFQYNYNGPIWTKVFSTRNVNIKSLSDYSSLDFGNSSFWYDEVAEYSSNGKTTNEFIFYDDAINSFEGAKLFSKKYTSLIHSLFQDGPKLSRETIFKKNGNQYDTLSRKDYDYEYVDFPAQSISNMIIDRRIVSSNLGSLGSGVDILYPVNSDYWPYDFNTQTGVYQTFDYEELHFNIGYYTIYPGFFRLQTQSEILYSTGGKTESNKTYTYDGQHRTYMLKEEMLTSTNGLETTNYKYPWAFNTGIAQLMVQKNMINVPFEINKTTNQSATLNKNIFSNETSITNGLILLREKQVLNNGAINTSMVVNKFDNWGNPLEIKENKVGADVFLWGYLGTQPVIKIENATYSEVIAALGASSTTILADLNKLNVREEYIQLVASALRSNVNLKKSMITSYTFKPLVGITSITDSKGTSEFYSYDTYGRLEYVKDFQGNIIKTFCYNFKGELIDCRVYLNTYQSAQFTKNNCGNGLQGSVVSYSVPAGSYMSTISINDANQKALADIADNGQEYANVNGTCGQPTVYVDVEIRKLSGWNGQIGRISFYKEGSSTQEFDIFPSNSGESEFINIPTGNYSRIRVNIDANGTLYDGVLSILNSNAAVCQDIGQGSVEINLTNVRFLETGNRQIIIAEYCYY